MNFRVSKIIKVDKIEWWNNNGYIIENEKK